MLSTPCTQCRLHHTCSNVLQMGKGKRSSKIMVVQENPFERESIRNEYMGGKAGKLFKTALAEVGIDLDDVYYTAVVKCTTPDDRMPLGDEVKACQDYLFAEIEVIKPEIIIPTGNMSMKALMGVTGITKHRGKMIEKDGIKYFPIIHPNLVLKQPKYMEFFSKDMINLSSILNGETPRDVVVYERERLYCETYESAVAEIQRLMDLPSGSRVVVDLEATKTNPFITQVNGVSDKTRTLFPDSVNTKISAIGFSDRPGYGCAIPLYHRETPFPNYIIGSIVKLLRALFSRTDIEFTAHNSKFEMKWLKAQLNIMVANMSWDTMLMHYLAVTEEKGTHGLKDLAWTETDMGGYDDAMDEYKPKGEDEGNYDLIPWDILKVYLADDCDVTFRLLIKFLPLIQENPELQWLWDNIMVPGYHTLHDIEMNGIKVDMEWLDFLCEEYPKELERINEKLHQFPEVIEMEREWQQMWAERCAIGAIKKADRTDEQQRKFEKYKKYDPSKGGTTFNFGSRQQLGELLFGRLDLSTPILTDKGEEHVKLGGMPGPEHYSTNDDSLKILAEQHPIAAILQEFRKVNHLNNNFVTGLRAMLDPEGFVHPNYNIHGTVTGRLSSDEPNAQQFPRKVNDMMLFQYWHEIKKLFVSRFGDEGVIVQFDYSQLELRILAVFSQDKALIELYRSGADLHKAIAADAFGVPIEEVTKDQRTASKKVQFGIVYQESAKGLSEALRSEGIDMSVDDCERFIAKYFKRFPDVEKWIRDIKRFAKNNKYVKTLTKRIRHLMALDSTDRSVASEAERQAVNAPIQSTGSDCTLMSLIIINSWLKENGYRSVICITVHDSIVLDCPKDEVIVVAKKVKHIMENLAEYNEFYEFLGDVPIVSEMEIGYSYGEAFECTIEELEEQGVDGFLQDQLAKKKAKEQETFKKWDEQGTKVPVYVHGYWNQAG
ncbi:DNA polymerase I [compost metagenome]